MCPATLIQTQFNFSYVPIEIVFSVEYVPYSLILFTYTINKSMTGQRDRYIQGQSGKPLNLLGLFTERQVRGKL